MQRRVTVAAGLFLGSLAAPPAAQHVHAAATQQAGAVQSSEFTVSNNEASMRLELAGRRDLEMSIRGGAVHVNGERIGTAPRGGPLDRQWRELLTRAMDVPPADLPRLLGEWTPAGETGARMKRTLEQVLAADAGGAAAAGQAVAPLPPGSDSLNRLMERINQLERQVQQAERRVVNQTPRRSSRGPLHYVGRGLSGIFSLLITCVVIFAIGVGVILFGGRPYLEGVGDTARNATMRSFLVGLASAFLVVPAFVIGIVALVISIIGIPAVLVWVLAFPVAVVGALLLGYLGVAHGLGEALAERRFYVSEWFQRRNSYYFLVAGIGLLIAFFLAAQVVYMAGPWLRVLNGMLNVLGVVTTFVAFAIGFGAVLISRAGTQPVGPVSIEEPDLFREGAGV